MTDTQRAAEIQAVLEGVPLPATRAELVAYAREQEPDVVRDLERLPDEVYAHLDQVGERLAPVAVPRRADGALPAPESGEPPGGDDYTRAFPDDTGRVRHDAPPGNPPQKAVEQASQTQKKQQAEQE